MLFFNPGKKIPGIPFIGNKINIFDPDMAEHIMIFPLTRGIMKVSLVIFFL